MKRRILCLGVLLIVSFLVQQSNAQQPVSEDLKSLANKYFELVQKEKFAEVSLLFHYPPKYTKTQLSQDRSVVGKAIDLLTSEFGQITVIQASKLQDSSYQVSIGGGDIPYWQENPVSVRVFYDVEFKKQGEGSIDIDFCKIKKAWEIRQVNYGFPITRPEANSLVMQAMMKMSQLTPDPSEE